MRQRAVTFVIMAGGKGERLWPLVRAASPKVCLSLNGTQTLLAATIDRLRAGWPHARWLIVTTREQAEAVRAALAHAFRQRVLVEPQIKNTAACITLAAAALAARDPRQVMVAAPADHWIGNLSAFRRALRTAIHAAVTYDTIATIGIRPTHPHPGLGYLCAGEPLAGSWGARVFRLSRFVEKPTRRVAQRLIKQPRAYWNSGIFVGTADTFLECVIEWLPDHVRRLVPLATLWQQDQDQPVSGRMSALMRRAQAAYRALDAVSFDHGVMDHVRRGLIVEGQFSWADLGSWDHWSQLSRGASRTVAVESRNVRVISPTGHLIATVGVRDLLIVHTPSATLICRSDRAQWVRAIVKRVASDPRLAAYR